MQFNEPLINEYNGKVDNRQFAIDICTAWYSEAVQLNGAQEGVTPEKAQEYCLQFEGRKRPTPIVYDGGPTAQVRSVFEATSFEIYTALYFYRYSLALAVVPFPPRRAQYPMNQM